VSNNEIPEETTVIGLSLMAEDLRTGLYLPIEIQKSSGEIIKTQALIDSGCTITTMNPRFVSEHNLVLCWKIRPIRALNVDGSENKIGRITHEAPIVFRWGSNEENWVHSTCNVANIGNLDIILGHDFLVTYNPIIDWRWRTADIAFQVNNLQTPEETPDVYCIDRINYEYEDLLQTYAELEFYW
jgi:hypothetical protein